MPLSIAQKSPIILNNMPILFPVAIAIYIKIIANKFTRVDSFIRAYSLMVTDYSKGDCFIRVFQSFLGNTIIVFVPGRAFCGTIGIIFSIY